MSNVCYSCLVKWIPEAIRTGRMTWEKINPLSKHTLLAGGYTPDADIQAWKDTVARRAREKTHARE